MADSLVLPTVQAEIERIIVLDQSAKESDVPSLIKRTRAMWVESDRAGDYYEVAKWALLASLKNTVIGEGPDQGKAKWQVTKIKPEEQLSLTWEEYCYNHLGMTPSEASNKKRNWEVYADQIGYGFRDLVRAGVQRLNIARSCFAKGLQTQALVDGVFGRHNVCSECGAEVVMDYRNPPKECPECGKPFVPVAPAKVALVQLEVDAIKNANKDQTEPVRVQADLERDGDTLILLPFIQLGEDRYNLPSWEIPILADDEVGQGVPTEILEEIMKFFRKKFK